MLAAFDSARGAIAAAVELQRRLADVTFSDESLPLPTGVGLDAGEAVPVEGGYRGGALNLAARLCGMAGPGEILASQEVAHLAGRMPDLAYEDRGQLQLKNISQPVRVVRVAPAKDDPAERFALLGSASPAARRKLRVAIRRGLRTGSRCAGAGPDRCGLRDRQPVAGRGGPDGGGAP